MVTSGPNKLQADLMKAHLFAHQDTYVFSLFSLSTRRYYPVHFCRYKCSKVLHPTQPEADGMSMSIRPRVDAACVECEEQDTLDRVIPTRIACYT